MRLKIDDLLPMILFLAAIAAASRTMLVGKGYLGFIYFLFNESKTTNSGMFMLVKFMFSKKATKIDEL